MFIIRNIFFTNRHDRRNCRVRCPRTFNIHKTLKLIKQKVAENKLRSFADYLTRAQNTEHVVIHIDVNSEYEI